jgi:hypothetical protein
MHPRTEDLLTIRDGEPIDAAVLERARSAPGFAAELEQLERMRRRLADLPLLEAPAEIWERVLAGGNTPASPRRPWVQWLARCALAAAVAGAAVAYLGRSADVVPPSGPPVVTTPATVVTHAPEVAPVVAASYIQLVEESERLERMLADIRYQRPMMSGRTASTIVGLEDRIAFIDEQLTYGAASGLQMPEQRALWSERVDLMNALVYVRLGQAEPGGF